VCVCVYVIGPLHGDRERSKKRKEQQKEAVADVAAAAMVALVVPAHLHSNPPIARMRQTASQAGRQKEKKKRIWEGERITYGIRCQSNPY
jgi:hypothetical protein